MNAVVQTRAARAPNACPRLPSAISSDDSCDDRRDDRRVYKRNLVHVNPRRARPQRSPERLPTVSEACCGLANRDELRPGTLNYAPPMAGSFTPEGDVPVQGNLGGNDQSLAALKSTVPPENSAP